LIYIGLGFWGASHIDSQYFVKSWFQGNLQSPEIALTFDDGPHPECTPAIAQILEKHQVKATFFCIGNQLAQYPEIARSLDQKGHLLGSHSYYHHTNFSIQRPSKITQELEHTDQVLYKVIRKQSCWFRPPYGVTNPLIATALQTYAEKGYPKHIIGWSIRSLDTLSKDPQKLVDRILKQLKPGSILLLHDTQEVTVQALDMLLEKIKQSGYRLVPLDHLLKLKAYA
jgi:peptidoglycan/xylan/chitin deacetylase (PgdA/CDA1 family)